MAWIKSWVIAFPSPLVFAPLVHGFVDKLLVQGKETTIDYLKQSHAVWIVTTTNKYDKVGDKDVLRCL